MNTVDSHRRAPGQSAPRAIHAVRFSAIALAVKVACGAVAFADLPTGGNVVSGAGSIGQSGNTMTVTQQTARMGVEWESFNVGAGQRVQFVQPDANSVALNRVMGSDGSKIMGSLDANGKVFLVNPNGVLFGKDAQVHTGGLVASTLDITDEHFNAGHYKFTKGAKAGGIVNSGNLTAGSVVLVAPTIENAGSINTHKGSTTLAAGEAVTVSVMNNGLITAQVDKATLNASIRNTGRIAADGGSISLQAGTADAVLDSLINTEGVLRAQSIEERDGRIFLGSGAGGTTIVGGTVDASGNAAGQVGGSVTALGKNVGIVEGATIDASGRDGGGTVLVGGNWQGKGPELNATAVVMQEGATIKADAKHHGNAGTVVLWSDDYTNFAGAITARGGEMGGNGGMVETSGKINLQSSGDVDASASRGTAGEWLLDPTDVYIRTSASSGTSSSGSDPLTFTATGSNAFINNGTINTALNRGTNVVITTNSSGPYGGHVYIEAPITKTSGGDATLTLLPNQNIYLNADNVISSTSGKLHVVMRSRSLDSNYGTELGEIRINGDIRTNGGDLTLGGGSSGTSYAYHPNGAAIFIDEGSTLDASGSGGGGSISMYGRAANGHGVQIAENTVLRTNGAGTISIRGEIRDSAGVGVQLHDYSTIAAQHGDITVSGEGKGDYGGLHFNRSTISTSTGNITLTGTNSTGFAGLFKPNYSTINSITSTTGTITLTGTTAGTGAAGIYFRGGRVGVTTGGAIVVNASGGAEQNALFSSLVNLNAGTGIRVSLSGSSADYSLYNNGGSMSTTSGDISITASRPIYMPGNISTGDGNVSITTTASSGTFENTFGSISSGSGNGGIDLRFGMPVTFDGAITSGSGDISIAGNSLTFNGNVSGTGRLSLMPYTTSASIGLGGGAGTLQLGSTLFNGAGRRFADGFSEIVIGRSNGTGLITVGALSVTDPLTLLAGGSGGAIRFTGALAAATNDVTARAHGNITINSSTGSITGQNIYLATDAGNFVNSRGASALNARGQWLVYAVSPTTNTYGNLASGNKAIWNQSFDTLAPGTAPSGNRYIFRYTPAGGTISGSLSKIYGDISIVETLSTSATPYTNTQGGMWLADTLEDVGLGSFTLTSAGLFSTGLDANANVGSYAVTLPTAYTDTGYAVTLHPSVRLEVLKRALTVTAQTDIRVYDGTTISTVTPSVTSGALVNGDTAHWLQAFDNKNAAAGKRLIASGTIDDGNGGNNYDVTFVDIDTGSITARALTANLIGTASKVYDGTTDIALANHNYVLHGVVSGDVVNLESANMATLLSKDVGTSKNVAVSGLHLLGADAGNYTVNGTANANIGVVTQRALTASLIGGATKIYDGNTGIALDGSNFALGGVLGADIVALNIPAAGTLGDKNVGAGKNVMVSGLSLSGADASNYSVSSFVSANIAEVTAKALTASLIGNVSRVYDGTTDIALTSGNYDLAGIVAGDAVELDHPLLGTLDTKHVGNDKNVAVTGLALLGADAANYTVNSSADADIAAISRRALTIAAVADAKVYDRTTDSDKAVDVTGVAIGDTVTATQSFDSRDAGNRTLSVDADYVVDDGNGGNNYLITRTDAVGTIDKRDVIVTVDANDKVYDGTTVATGTVTGISNLIAGDQVFSDGTASFSFADKNVGNDKGVAVRGMTLTGADVGNYRMASVGASHASITPATLIVAAVPNSKIYGAADTSLTYGYSGLQGSDDASVFSGALTRAAGENVGLYTIGQGTLSAGGNYAIAYSDATFRINPATLTIGALAGTKVYGDADPGFGYDVSGLVNGDDASVLSGALTRTSGENVGSYGIHLGSLSAGSNYTIAYAGNVFGITRRTLSIDANDLAKIYGDVDPALGFAHGALYNGDTSAIFSGSLERAAGENVGSYAIGQGSLAAGNNYDMVFTGGDFSITPRALTISANARGKSYGDLDPTLSFSHGALVNGDTAAIFTGELTRTAGENVGSYSISQGTLAAGSNYVIDFTGNLFDISTGLLVVNANARSKVYGDADPTLTYTFSGLMNGDDAAVFTGGLTRVAGENVGNYAIGLGSLDAGSNYTIQLHSADLAITPRDLYVTADAVSKIYGSIDPSLTYAYTGLTNGDTASVFGGALARSSGENVNGYAITQGSLSAGSNYALHYSGNTFSITPATLSVVANGQTKVYGDIDPTLSFTYAGLVNGDTAAVFGGDLTRVAGETVLGGPYAIGPGTLSAGGNYIIDFTGNHLVVTPKALLVDVATHLTKVYDGTTALPVGTEAYHVSGRVGSDDVDVLGLLAFDDRNVGVHSISLSGMSLRGADSSNYYLPTTSATGSVTITARAITVTAQGDTKMYDGTTSSNLAALLTSGSLAGGDTASWSQAFDDRNAGTGKALTASGVIYDGNGGNNYSVTFIDNTDGVIERRAITVTAQADSKVYDGTVLSAVAPVLTAGSLADGDAAAWGQSFDDARVGTGKTLRANGVADDGNGGNNYHVTFVDNTSGIILAANAGGNDSTGGGNGGKGGDHGSGDGADGAYDPVIAIVRGAELINQRDRDPSNPGSWFASGVGRDGSGNGVSRGRFLRGDDTIEQRDGAVDSAGTESRQTGHAIDSCAGSGNRGVRMPERPAKFLENEQERRDGTCSFFE